MAAWRVLLTEPIHPAGLDLLRAECDVRLASAMTAEAVHAEAADADAIVVRTRPTITAAIMDAAPRLRVIGRHGVGLDNIDLAAAAERRIAVVYTPGANDQAVAEHAIALLLALCRKLAAADAAVRAGDWAWRNRELTRELAGTTLGVVGMGRIGFKVASVAHAIGMQIIYHDAVAVPAAEGQLGARRVPLATLLRTSDAVTLHAPLLPETRGLIGAAQLAIMQPHAVLINTARGELVDTAALLAALEAGHLAGAGLDVYDPEPPPPESPLLRHPGVMLTPHAAALTTATMERMGRTVAAEVLTYLRTGTARYLATR